MKYCVDCIHREPSSGGDKCKANRDLVTGIPLDCRAMRYIGPCGREGVQYYPKPQAESVA